MLELCLKTGWSLEYVENLSYEVLSEFKALAAWKPFNDDTVHQMLGELCSMQSHVVYKQGYKATERFPFLKSGIPDHLEDELVLKAKRLTSNYMGMPEERSNAMREEVVKAIKEEIEEELQKDIVDHYVVNQLRKLIG